MAKKFVCTECNKEYTQEEVQKTKGICSECMGIIEEIEIKTKEYILEFDNFKISVNLPAKIGRNYQDELKENRYISREHCEILEENGLILVIDKSTNGTFINGDKISTKTSINIGDRLKLANIEAIFKEKE